MRKVANIAWKDLTISFRDSTALIVMLAAPFALTLVTAFAFGGLGGGGSSGLQNIPVVIVNHDPGQFGAYLEDLFTSPELADLVEPTSMTSDADARQLVDDDKTAAAVLIPANFSGSILPSGGATGPASSGTITQSVIEVYTNPARPVSSAIVQEIVQQFLSRIAAGSAAGRVTVSQMIANGLLSPQEALSKGLEVGERAARAATDTQLVAVAGETASREADAGFDWLTYMAPSMAILFLMFTVSNGAKTLLAERDWGTLPRMLSTPTPTAQVLGGKIGGIYVTGAAQMGILLAASGLIFQVRWGSPLAVVLVTLALVAAATGWGALLAAYARTAPQANQIGSVLALLFGGLAGNFFPREGLPQVVQTASYITPNAWGLDAFGKLTAGGGLTDVVTPIIALLVMALVLFGVAVLTFRRQYAS